MERTRGCIKRRTGLDYDRRKEDLKMYITHNFLASPMNAPCSAGSCFFCRISRETELKPSFQSMPEAWEKEDIKGLQTVYPFCSTSKSISLWKWVNNFYTHAFYGLRSTVFSFQLRLERKIMFWGKIGFPTKATTDCSSFHKANRTLRKIKRNILFFFLVSPTSTTTTYSALSVTLLYSKIKLFFVPFFSSMYS
jgi:hypothetical protein